MEQVRQILTLAKEEGISGIVATPHYEIGRRNEDVSELRRLLEEVRREAPQGLQIHLGNELLYSPGIIEALNQGKALTIADTRYILVEFMPTVKYYELCEAVRTILLAGYIPIIAHAERYHCLLKKPDYVKVLINTGAYIQINISSIAYSTLYSTGRFCRKLFDRRWVHFLGTDTHDLIHRGPYVKKFLRKLKKRYKDEYIHSIIWDNPVRMLENKPL
jgi:protein-tyrosine phosphatase